MLIQGVLPMNSPRHRASRPSAASGISATTDGLSPESHFPAPSLGQVLPSRIQLLNQTNLLCPAPTLELLFTANRDLHVLEALIVDKAVALIFLRKTLNGIVFVLMNALLEESSDPNVERTGAAG